MVSHASSKYWEYLKVLYLTLPYFTVLYLTLQSSITCKRNPPSLARPTSPFDLSKVS